MRYKTSQGGLWTSLLAKKLVTSHDEIYDVIMEVNEELIKMQFEDMPCMFAATRAIVSTLTTTICLLKECSICN